METKLHLIAHVSVSKSKDKLWYFDSIFNVKHVRTLHMISVPFTRPSKLFFRGKKSSCQLFVWMQFVFNFLVSFLLFSSIRESRDNKVGCGLIPISV